MNKIPIVLAFTPNYFVPAATCLLSIFKNTTANARFHIICLLSEELPEKFEEDLKLLVEKERADFSFIYLGGQLSGVYVDEKYSIATMFRLLTPRLLPEHDKIIYIDCDIIVQNDLAELYSSIDLGENYLGGVREAPLDFQLKHLRSIGCDAGYVNAGFLVMNLKQLRQDNMAERFVERAYVGGLEFFDQDILNILCHGRIVFLPPYYNSIRTFYLPEYKKDFFKCYDEEDYMNVLDHGTVHYTGSKPWNTFTVKFDLWWWYYEQLPQQIKDYGQVSKNIHMLYKVYDTKVGRLLIDGLKTVYRKIRSKRT